MSKLIYISSLLIFISFVNCQKINKEDAYDKLDKTRKGHLLTLDDCFSIFVANSIGTIIYDGASKPLKDINILEGSSCLKDQDKEKDSNGKEIITSKVAKVRLEFVVDGIENLNKVIVELSIKLDLNNLIWNLDEKVIIGNNKDGKEARLTLDVDHLEAPSSYSFSCNKFELTKSFYQKEKPDKEDSFENKFSKIVLDDFQIQPFKGELFNDSYDCSTWFTIGTFTGLIFLLLFTSILAFGILYIMNIKSNDRFEDPKGKPLNIGLTDN